MQDKARIPARQVQALVNIRRYETKEFGVIVDPTVTGQALVRRGFAVEAKRRSFARATGMCLRLTEAGREFIKDYK